MPFVVGLRNEIKETNKAIEKLAKKPDIKKLSVDNFPTQKDVVFPETQKVEVENNIKTIEVSNFPNEINVRGFNAMPKSLEKGFKFLSDYLSSSSKDVAQLISDALANTFNVRVTNPQTFPKEMKVTVQNQKDFPTSFKILNKEAKDAIPVILTSKDRKKFYNALEAIQSVISDNGSSKLVDQGVGGDSRWSVIDTVHKYVHSGNYFSGGVYNGAVANAGTLTILVQNGADFMHTVFSAVVTGNSTIKLFENPTFSIAGTAVTMSNHNRSSAKVLLGTVTHTPTVSNNGIQINGTSLMAGGEKSKALGSEFGGFGSEFVLAKNTNYLIQITNNSGASAEMDLHLNCYQPNI